MKSKIIKLTAAACVVFAIGVETFLKDDSRIIPTHSGNQKQQLADELMQVRQMIAVNDFKGLYGVLSDGQFESKVVAANFLAKMGEVPELVEMPAFESVSMYAKGNLILDCVTGNMMLRSTEADEWLEVTNEKIKVHINQNVHEAKKVRIICNTEGIRENREQYDKEFANLRKERTDLELELAKLNQNTQDDEVKKLRERLVKYNELLDTVDNAVYVDIEGNNLKLDNPKYNRTAIAELMDGTVKVEWHGHFVEGNSVTFWYNLAPVLTDGPPKPTPNWRERFDAVYSLNEGEIIRWVRTPYIPERQIYATQELHYYSSSDNPPPPGYLSFFWDGSQARNWTLMVSGEGSLSMVLMDMGLQLYEYKIESDKLSNLRLNGDWIIREKASKEEKILALEKILQSELDPNITFEKRKVNCDVIIVKGQYKHIPLEGAERSDLIYVPFVGGGTGSLEEILKKVGGNFDRPMIFEKENLSNIRVAYNRGLYAYSRSKLESKTNEEKQEILDSAMDYLSKQTSLQFEYGKSEQYVWFITDKSGDKQ